MAKHAQCLTDKEFEAQKNRLRALFWKWETILGLRLWQRVDLIFDREFFSEERTGHPHNCVAYADASWEYLKGSVTFSLPKLIDLDDDELDYVVRHEFAHLLVNQMREYDGSRHKETVKHEEMVVTRLAQAFDWVYTAGLKAGKKKEKEKKK